MAGWKLHPLRRRQFKGVIASGTEWSVAIFRIASRNDIFDVIASGTEWSVAIFRIASRNDSLEVGCGRLEVRI